MQEEARGRLLEEVVRLGVVHEQEEEMGKRGIDEPVECDERDRSEESGRRCIEENDVMKRKEEEVEQCRHRR